MKTFYFILLAISATWTSSQCFDIEGLEFMADQVQEKYVPIQPIVSNLRTSDLSICLRVKLWSFGSCSIISSRYLGVRFHSYKYDGGSFDLFGYYGTFSTKGVKYSPIFWNSICLVFDSSRELLTAAINDADITMTNFAKVRESESHNFSGPIAIGENGPWNSFSGQVTDLNVWNRPLSLLEVKEFVSECSNNFTNR